MKKILLFGIILMSTLSVNAQSIQFGVKAGLNLCSESKHSYGGGLSLNFDNRVGLSVGGVANIPLAEDFEIEADVLYSLQGCKEEVFTSLDPLDNTKENYYITSHYINIPVSVKYYLSDGLYLECGPQVGFLLGKNYSGEDLLGENIYASSYTKKVDFSVLVGAGYKFDNNIFVNARFTHGFTDTSKLYEGGKNRNIQLSVGYLF